MGKTLIVLDRQASARVFTFGSSSSGGEALITFEKGAQAASYVVADFKGSINVGGDLNVTGDLNITGAINQQTVTNLEVKDKTITLNNGGNTAGAAGAGILVEGNSGSTIAKLIYDSSLASKFKMGDGSTQYEVVTVDHTQTLTNKSINASSNTITDTSAAQGDLFIFNGTKFVRFPKGTASQSIRVKADGSDLEFYTPTAGATTKAVTVSGTQDSVNKSFTISQAVTSGSELVYLNGQLLTPGASNDYVLTSTTLTFQSAIEAPAATDTIRVYGAY